MKNINGFWVDTNGNKWDMLRDSKHQAQRKSQTLVNCKNCTNCFECKNCENCTDSRNCKNCTDMRECANCTDSKHCYLCYNGKLIFGESDKYYCTKCTKCQECKENK